MSKVPANQNIGPIDHIRHYAKSHVGHFGALAPQFPKSLSRLRRITLDQLYSEFCTAFGEATSNGYEQDQDFSGEFQTAAEGKYLGSPIINGADPYPSMQATTIVGSLIASRSPFNLADKGDVFIADWSNWAADLFTAALPYKSTLTPYYIDGPFDTFDNIRDALYQAFLAKEKGVVKAFGFWYASWNSQAQNSALKGRLQCPPLTESPVSRHRYTFIDFDVDAKGEPVLVAALTQGSDFGDRGFLYFDRATINQVFASSSSNGLGLYINRPAKDGWGQTFQWIISIIQFIKSKITLAAKKPAASPYPPEAPQPVPVPAPNTLNTPAQEKLYTAIKESLGQRKTLNGEVSAEYGCAEAWSSVGKDAGIKGIPVQGFASTAVLESWLASNTDFEEIFAPEIAATIISATRGAQHGHVGYFGAKGLQYVDDWGICSNDSNTGLFSEQWNLTRWIAYYRGTLGLRVRYFRWKG